MPNFNSLAMEPMVEIAGTVSSFVGAGMTGQHSDGMAIPLLVDFTAFGTTALGIVLMAGRGRFFGTRSAQQWGANDHIVTKFDPFLSHAFRASRRYSFIGRSGIETTACAAVP